MARRGVRLIVAHAPRAPPVVYDLAVYHHVRWKGGLHLYITHTICYVDFENDDMCEDHDTLLDFPGYNAPDR